MPNEPHVERYRDADDAVFAVLEEHGAAMFETLASTTFPRTYRTMFGFCAKAGFLKTALFDMIQTENPYAFKALFRCFCEHYLKFTYVFFRFVSEKTDAVGVEYHDHCSAVETREYIAALKAAASLMPNAPSVDPQEITAALNKAHPGVAGLSDGELEEVAKRFKYRAIIRYLHRVSPNLISGPNSFLLEVLTEYAHLSSFVHGGPWTESDMFHGTQEAAVQKCQGLAALAFMMHASVLMFTAMAVSREYPKVGVLAGKINVVLGAYQKETAPESPEVSHGPSKAS
jgi:hypothetical protein